MKRSSTSPRECIKKRTFINVDLSGEDFDGAWIERCLFKNVILDRADFSDITDADNTFEDCSFKYTRFSGAALGGRGTRYRDCTFLESRFRGAVFTRAEFDACEFVSCDLKGVDFHASSFADCRFEGKLEDVWFRGGFALPSEVKTFGTPRKNKMERVDFSAASFWYVDFTDDCDLSTVRIPEDGQHRFFDNWKSRLERVASAMEEWSPTEREEGLKFIETHMIHATDQKYFILNRQNLAHAYGPGLADRILAALTLP